MLTWFLDASTQILSKSRVLILIIIFIYLVGCNDSNSVRLLGKNAYIIPDPVNLTYCMRDSANIYISYLDKNTDSSFLSSFSLDGKVQWTIVKDKTERNHCMTKKYIVITNSDQTRFINKANGEVLGSKPFCHCISDSLYLYNNEDSTFIRTIKHNLLVLSKNKSLFPIHVDNNIVFSIDNTNLITYDYKENIFALQKKLPESPFVLDPIVANKSNIIYKNNNDLYIINKQKGDVSFKLSFPNIDQYKIFNNNLIAVLTNHNKVITFQINEGECKKLNEWDLQIKGTSNYINIRNDNVLLEDNKVIVGKKNSFTIYDLNGNRIYNQTVENEIQAIICYTQAKLFYLTEYGTFMKTVNL